jgi:hypothetical protein
MAVPWGAIINGVVSIVSSFFSNKSKSDALKVSQDSASKAAAAMAQEITKKKLLEAGYVEQDGLLKVPWEFQNDEHKALSQSAKDGRFTNQQLSDSDKKKLDDYTAKSMVKYNALSSRGNSIAATVQASVSSGSASNPVTNPDGGYSSGMGSSTDPLDLPFDTVITSGPDTKKAGMSPLLILGLVAAGGGVLYAANKNGKPKRRR